MIKVRKASKPAVVAIRQATIKELADYEKFRQNKAEAANKSK